MVLADSVKDLNGRLLMGKGTLLTPKAINICKIWGVIEADIEGISSEEADAVSIQKFDVATMTAAEEIVRKRFALMDMDHPAAREFFRICALREAEGKHCHHGNIQQESSHRPDIKDIRNEKLPEINPLKFIKDDTRLSTLPDIFRQIIEAISKPNSSARDIADVISKDPNLAARLLKIVNSAFYGYPSKIDTLSHAVNIIGTKQLSTLATGVNIIQMFKNIPSTIIDMKSFWKHSILCGINARLIAGYKNIQNTERMFVAGLLHDIGRLILYNHAPAQSLRAITIARDEATPLYLVERQELHYDHGNIGGELLKKWKLPTSLEDIVRHHHNPDKSQNMLESAIVHLSDIMANAMGIGSSGEQWVPPLNNDAWMQIGLSPHILSLTIEQSDRQINDIFESIFTDEKYD